MSISPKMKYHSVFEEGLSIKKAEPYYSVSPNQCSWDPKCSQKITHLHIKVQIFRNSLVGTLGPLKD